jgi:predicted DNA-binding ribbon-helix-helix protein
MDASSLFRVDGMIAVVTGGATGNFSLSLRVLCCRWHHRYYNKRVAHKPLSASLLQVHHYKVYYIYIPC